MTIFGVDVSEHQNGMSLARARREGIDFVILRLCDGTYKDKVFRSHLQDAESAGLLVAAYWYLRAPSEGTTIAQQVDVIDQQMGGRRDLPVWIDVESVGAGGRKLLTSGDVWAAKRELERRGYTVAGIYSGAWYWEQMPGGEPSMDGLGALWVSSYGRNRTGAYRDVYAGEGGDQHKGWSYPLGDKCPDILQYGSNGNVAGYTVDVNAFKGSRDQLKTLFTAAKAKPTPPAEKPERTAVEKVLKYSREQVRQDTGYYCGPASTQTIIQAATGKIIPESTLAKALGTHVGGTDYIGQFPKVLNAYLAGAGYTHRDMPNDPPTAAQREQLWKDLTGSIDAGFGVVANFVAPPSNYPRAVAPSTISPAYRGGTVYHYVAAMGYAGSGGSRRVWIADSGFDPYGYWVSFEQFARLIPPKGYAFAAAKTVVKPAPTPASPAPKHTTPAPAADDVATRLARIEKNLDLVIDQLAGPARDTKGPKFTGWPQLGGLTPVDAIGKILEIVKENK